MKHRLPLCASSGGRFTPPIIPLFQTPEVGARGHETERLPFVLLWKRAAEDPDPREERCGSRRRSFGAIVEPPAPRAESQQPGARPGILAITMSDVEVFGRLKKKKSFLRPDSHLAAGLLYARRPGDPTHSCRLTGHRRLRRRLALDGGGNK